MPVLKIESLNTDQATRPDLNRQRMVEVGPCRVPADNHVKACFISTFLRYKIVFFYLSLQLNDRKQA